MSGEAATSHPAVARAIWWEDLDHWIIPSRSVSTNTLPKGWVRARIGDIVTQVSHRIKPEPESDYKLAGVKWYGEGVFYRETVRGAESSASHLTPLVPNALIYNRLFAWKASFAVVPSSLSDCFVSNEFPQFLVDDTRVLSEYLYLYCTREQVVRAVNSSSTGSAAVSRNRFREEEFLNFEIPLPPLGRQREIVATRNAELSRSSALFKKAADLANSVDSRFLKALGLRSPDELPSLSAFCVSWDQAERWGVRFNRLQQGGADISLGRYPVAQLGDVLSLIQYGTSEKANTASSGVPVLRIGNIKERAVDLTDLKYIPKPKDRLENLLLKSGDVLIIRTSGSRDLVGTCAVFRGQGDYVFASYLIRLRFTEDVLPEFASWFLNGPLGRQQIDAVSRQIMQNNINSEELRGLQIPLPPVDEQKRIVSDVQAAMREVAVARSSAVSVLLALSKKLDTELLPE